MTPDQKKTYTRWKQLVNMSRSELQSFYDSKEGKEAGLKPKEASKQGIHYGRESARWILKMKATPVEDWTETMWKWAGRQISFISRMSKAKGELIDEKGNKTRKYLSLLIWGHDPKKMKAGGRLQQGEKNAKQTDDLLYNFEEDQIIGNQSDTAGQMMEKGGEIELLAPNGKKSNLTCEQWRLVRTPEFINWFGDWIKDPENASKVVDENGEPMVVYHGGLKKINIFNSENGINYFTPNIRIAEDFAKYKYGSEGKVFNVFLNIRNPKLFDVIYYYELELEKKELYDGFIANYVILEDGTNEGKQFVCFSPKQIKLADGTNKTFDPMNPDIKYRKGGKLPALKKPKSIVTIAKQQKVQLKYAMNQLMTGIKVESEHTKDKNVAKTIALHHLDENIYYYEALKKMENNLDKGKFAKGGTVYGDGKHSKDAKDGGYFKGNSHANGGIKAVVKDTGQMVEVEGNEIIINKRSVADNTKREFEGELLTNREILSRINQSGGGVAFAEGGEVPETISVTGKQYKIGGELVKDSDFVHSCGCKHKMQEGGEVEDQDIMIIEGESDYELPVHFEENQSVNIEEIKPDHYSNDKAYYFRGSYLSLDPETPVIEVGSIFYGNKGNTSWQVDHFTTDGVYLKHLQSSPLDIKLDDTVLSFDEIGKLFNDGSIMIKNINSKREFDLALTLVKTYISEQGIGIPKYKNGGTVVSESEAREWFENLSDDQKSKLNDAVAFAILEVTEQYRKRLIESESKKSDYKQELNQLIEQDRELQLNSSDYELKRKVWEQKDIVRARIKAGDIELSHLKNVVKCLENGGTLIQIEDKKGIIHTEIPSFCEVKTETISFDQETILATDVPLYIPVINEDVFRQKGYVFDAIRIAKDKYLLASNGYKEKKDSRAEQSAHPSSADQGYVLVTLDQLVLINDYYFTKAKALLQKEAEESTERQLKYYDNLPVEKRMAFVNQKNFYNVLPVSIKKKISQAEYEQLSFEDKEKVYKPYKRYSAKRISSKLEENEMWASFHNMYERFLNPEATQPKPRYANPEVFQYWRKFRDMMSFKIKDIQMQREVDNEQYKKALETSFGDTNTNDILLADYGILTKRQDGKPIAPVQINQIQEGWTLVNENFGNLVDISKQVSLKVSHTTNTNVFASKAIGVFVPKMVTIAVSSKHGDQQFNCTFAHEAAHYIDWHLGSKYGKRFMTDDYESSAGVLAFEFRRLLNQKSNSDYINATKECFARALEQHFAMSVYGDDVAMGNMLGLYVSDANYVSRDNYYTHIKPLIETFFGDAGLSVFVKPQKVEAATEPIDAKADELLEQAQLEAEIQNSIDNAIPEVVETEADKNLKEQTTHEQLSAKEKAENQIKAINLSIKFLSGIELDRALAVLNSLQLSLKFLK